LAFRSTTPQGGWEQALLDLPEGEGAPGFALYPKSLNISAALRLVPALPPALKPIYDKNLLAITGSKALLLFSLYFSKDELP
jgi:hypothetical protein